MQDIERRNPAEPEFIQAVREVVESVIDTVNDNPRYLRNRILERITEPDRVISFKVEWEDDDGNIRAFRWIFGQWPKLCRECRLRAAWWGRSRSIPVSAAADT